MSEAETEMKLAGLPLAFSLITQTPDVHVYALTDGRVRIDHSRPMTVHEMKDQLHVLAAHHGGCLHIAVVGEDAATKQTIVAFVATIDFVCGPSPPRHWVPIPGFPGSFVDVANIYRGNIPMGGNSGERGGFRPDASADLKVNGEIAAHTHFYCGLHDMKFGPDGSMGGGGKPLVSSAIYAAAIPLVCGTSTRRPQRQVCSSGQRTNCRT